MSFPILRADLNDVTSPKLNLSDVELPETSIFTDKRVLNLSKEITNAALSGLKSCTVSIFIKKNYEPVSAGLKINFPDVTFTVIDKPLDTISTLHDEYDTLPDEYTTMRPIKILVDWS